MIQISKVFLSSISFFNKLFICMEKTIMRVINCSIFCTPHNDYSPFKNFLGALCFFLHFFISSYTISDNEIDLSHTYFILKILNICDQIFIINQIRRKVLKKPHYIQNLFRVKITKKRISVGPPPPSQ